MIASGITPELPIILGEHIPLSGPCSRVSNTFEYICEFVSECSSVAGLIWPPLYDTGGIGYFDIVLLAVRIVY